jgi:hypothetical protein
MIEIALLVGLGAVGYLLATQHPTKENFKQAHSSRSIEDHKDDVNHTDSQKGHSNEVPFFGSNITQSMYSGGTNHVLDNHTGAGKEYYQKKEVRSFFDAKPGTGNPYGNQNESDFYQSRMVSGQNMNNVFPVEQVQVGPGGNDGYTNIPKGGYQQDQLREYAIPRTTDELRIDTKPKLSYQPPVIRGTNVVTLPGVQADVNKNKPDRFAIYGMDRVNTTKGAQTAQALYPEQIFKTQARETTEVEYYGGGGNVAGVVASYVRSFTEPFQEFMKLTAEGRPGPAGSQGTGIPLGAEGYSAQTKKDETVLSDATRFNVPQQIMTSSMEHLGSYTYKPPLQQDVYVQRNGPEVVKALNDNPYSLPLNSY